MKLQDQVCTLEQAKRFKDLGVHQSSAFVHIFYLDDVDLTNGKKSYRREVVFMNWQANLLKDNEWYAAFTVAELGVMLKQFVECVNLMPVELWRACYEHATIDKRERNCGTGTTIYEAVHKIESEARAAMLIYLLENKLITPEEVNQCLIQ